MLSERLPWIGEDPASQKLFELAQRVAPVPTTILINGESGTGKKYLARLIHELGPRRDTPFIQINSTTLPGKLVEAELFGYERGGFPGAGERKLGAFELSLKGTVVLEEVAALTPQTQERLLRLLEEQKLERLGGKESVRVEARLIAVTNVDMNSAVKDGRFRGDLYQRLDMAKIWVPPLRERQADILPLTEHLLEILRTEHGKPLVRLGEKTKTLFQAYGWPGNVRELESVLERAIVHTKSETLEPEDFPAEIQAAGRHNGNGNGSLRALEDVERETILVTLEATEYQIGKSAQILGISRKTLLEKRKKFGMK
ncbi:MAG TPA: sigma-54 dependent transcriptional regulator [Candidatus Acidoferrum sp.]